MIIVNWQFRFQFGLAHARPRVAYLRHSRTIVCARLVTNRREFDNCLGFESPVAPLNLPANCHVGGPLGPIELPKTSDVVSKGAAQSRGTVIATAPRISTAVSRRARRDDSRGPREADDADEGPVPLNHVAAEPVRGPVIEQPRGRQARAVAEGRGPHRGGSASRSSLESTKMGRAGLPVASSK